MTLVDAVASALRDFPHETVPDGAVFGPHHAYVGVLALFVVVFVVADDYRRREPVLALAGGLTTLFAFATVWPYYPVTGAALSLAGLALALAGVAWPGGVWAAYSLRARAAALLAVAVATDDVVEHAFGVPTPLDAAWRLVYPFVP